MENMEENSEKIGKMRKKVKLNSEMIWNKWKISVLVIITAKESSFSSSLPPPTPAEAAIHTYPRAAAAGAAEVT